MHYKKIDNNIYCSKIIIINDFLTTYVYRKKEPI